MATINYISGDPSLPASWTGGVVPGSGDVASFIGTSAVCTLTGATEWGGVSFTGYTNTLDTAGFSWTLGASGFNCPTAITGIVNLRASTVTCSGPVDFRGILVSQLIDTQATWIQQGGTLAVPNKWQDGASTTNQRVFLRWILDEGSFTHLLPGNIYYRCNIDIKGYVKITSRLACLAAGKTINYFSTGTTDGGEVYIYAATLTGKTSNITSGKILVVQAKLVADSISVPVTISKPSVDAVASTSTVSGNISGPITIINDNSNYALNLILDNAFIMGDVTTSSAAVGVSTVTGNIKLSSTADQTLDFSGLAQYPTITCDKTVGRVNLTGNGTMKLRENSRFDGGLKFLSTFTGTFDTDNYEVQVKNFDASAMVAGVGRVEFRDSIIRSTGNVQFGTDTMQNVVTDNSTWYVSGGTATTRAVFGSITKEGVEKFKKIVFGEGSFIQLDLGYRIWVTDTVIINGDVYRNNGNWANMAANQHLTPIPIVIGENAKLTGKSLPVYGGNVGIVFDYNMILTGATRNIENIVLARYGAKIAGDLYKCPVSIHASTKYAYFSSIADNVIFENNLFMEQVLTTEIEDEVKIFTIAIGNNVQCYGNVHTESDDPGKLVITGGVTLSGAQPQTVDFLAAIPVTEPRHIEFNKPASGIVALKSNHAMCMKGIQRSLLKLIGAGTFTTCGDFEVGGIDKRELTGSFTPGNGRFLSRPTCTELAYTASRFFASITEGKYMTSTGGVVQDARNI